MRVDPAYVSNLVNALDQSQSTSQQLSSELSSGVRVTSLSTDPLAAGENVRLLNQMQQDDSFTQSANSMPSDLVRNASTRIASRLPAINVDVRAGHVAC